MIVGLLLPVQHFRETAAPWNTNPCPTCNAHDIPHDRNVSWFLEHYTLGASTYTLTVEAPTVDAGRRRMLAFITSHPLISDDAWCKKNPALSEAGFTWAGDYVTGLNSESECGQTNSCETVLEQDQMTPWHTTCGHCAAIRGLAEKSAAVAGGRTSCVVEVYAEDPTDWVNTYRTPYAELSTDQPTYTRRTIMDVALRDLGTTCASCHRLGHEQEGCNRPPPTYSLTGVEMEGRFLRSRLSQLQVDNSGCSDGSVHNSTDPNLKGWEFQSKPALLSGTVVEMLKLYPDETGEDCGMHVHVSFRNKADIGLLATTKFYDFFRDRWQAWGTKHKLHPKSSFFRRLNGENDYCRPNHYEGMRYMEQDRYLQLNFQAWEKHRTMECRLLPMFRRASLGASAIVELLDIIDDYLNAVEDVVAPEPVVVSLDNAAPHEPRYAEFPVEVPSMFPYMVSLPVYAPEYEPPAPGMVRLAMTQSMMLNLRDLRLLAS